MLSARTKRLVILTILSIFAVMIIAGSGAVAKVNSPINTTTQITDMNGLNPNTEQVAFPPDSVVTFSGTVTVAAGKPEPTGYPVILQYRLQGTTAWNPATTIPSAVLVHSDGTFSGRFTAPSDQGTYEFQVVFLNANEGSNGNHWQRSDATVVGFVLPEYNIAALGAMLSCFGAFVLVKKRDSLPHFK